MTQQKPSPVPWTVLRGHAAEVQAVDFLDGQRLFSGDSDGCVKLWDLRTRRSVQHASLHTAQAGVLSLQVGCTAAGGILLFSAGRNGQLLAHAVTPSGVLDSHPTLSVATSTYGFCHPHATPCVPTGPTRTRTSTSSSGRNSRASGGAEGSTAPSGADTVQPTGRGGVGTAQEPNLETTQGSSTAQPSPALGCDGWLVACAGINPGQVQVWDTRAASTAHPTIVLSPPDISGQPPTTSANTDAELGSSSAQAHTVGQATCLHFVGPQGGASPAPQGPGQGQAADHVPEHQHQLLVGYESGSLALWDLRAAGRGPGALVARAHTEPVLCCAVAPGGGEAVSGSADTSLRLWSLGTPPSSALQPVVVHTLPEPGVSDLAWREDGRVLAAAGWDGKVRVYSGKRGHKPLAILRHHTREVTALAWAPRPSSSSCMEGYGGGGSGVLASGAPEEEAEDEVEEGVDGGAQHARGAAARQGQGGGGGEVLGMLASASRDSSIALWLLYGWVDPGRED